MLLHVAIANGEHVDLPLPPGDDKGGRTTVAAQQQQVPAGAVPVVATLCTPTAARGPHGAASQGQFEAFVDQQCTWFSLAEATFEQYNINSRLPALSEETLDPGESSGRHARAVAAAIRVGMSTII